MCSSDLLADVDLLISDKTGTLTENRIRVDSILLLAAQDEKEVVEFATSATDPAEGNVLENAVISKAKELLVAGLPQINFTPGDSERKRSTTTVTKDNDKWIITLGAPSIVKTLCTFPNKELEKKFDDGVEEAAMRGDRALVVAARQNATAEKDLSPLGILFLSDTLRADAKTTLAAMRDEGITVKMLTGDGIEIARQVAKELDLKGDIAPRSIFDSPDTLTQAVEAAGGFAEVLPKDKFLAVETEKKSHVVAMTGDGVNDVPPVKAADVGIAVKNAVDALRSTADIEIGRAHV